MAANSATATRADRARKYVEMGAVELVFNNVLTRFVDNDEGSGVFDAVDVSNLYLTDAHHYGKHSTQNLFLEFYPDIDEGPTTEQLILAAEMEAVAASLLAMLSTPEVCEFCALESARLSALAASNAAKAREMLGGDDA